MKTMDDRGVSEVMGYTMATVTFIALMSGSVLTTDLFTKQQSAETTMNRFQEQGEILASELQTVDRLTRESNSNGTIRTTVSLPGKIGDSYYDVTIYSPSDAATTTNCGPPADAPHVGCIFFNTHEDFGDLSSDQATYYALGAGMTVNTTTVEAGDIRIEHTGQDSNPINITEVAT